MRNKISIKKRAEKVPADIRMQVELSMATARQIMRILEKQGKTQKDLAALLGKKESQVSKWLQGTHNFTFKTISKIQLALGEPIIIAASQAIRKLVVYTVDSNTTTENLIMSEDNSTFISFSEGKKFTVSESTFEGNFINKLDLKKASCIN